MCPPIENPKKQLGELGAAARKTFSQNFLKDQNVALRLVDGALSAERLDVVWEIGPGLGALTDLLLKRSPVPVRLFEIDRKLAEALRVKHPETPLVEGDFLKMPLDTFDVGKRISLLSNLPYAISSQILFRLADERHRFVQAVLTFQKEFADRLHARPRTKDYGSLSVVMQLAFKIESLGNIPATAFYPAPKVESQALKFTPLPEFDPGVEAVKAVAKMAFLHRRKKLSSNLKDRYGADRVKAAWEAMELSDNVRAEELTPVDFVRLTKLLS